MLFFATELPLNDQNWRRINMRKVSHLIAAEMIHNLYNRHWPRINSLRFRHTITNFKDGIVESYAPINEWTYLQRWLSEKFLATDPILIREIEAILNPSYDLVQEVMEKVEKSDLKSLSNQELALLLIDIMDFPLGDIYKLNVVQIEYSLNFALHKLLEEYEPNLLDRNELLAQLIAPGEFTIAQKEEITFGQIMAMGQSQKVAHPSMSKEVMKLLIEHHEQFGSTHCAYGEEPPALEDYINKYIFLYNQGKEPLTRKAAEENVVRQQEKSRKLLAKLNNPKLGQLCDLMAKVGVFRDYNKAKLGETVVKRIRILDEIARRTNVPRTDIDYYLMVELAALLDVDKKLSSEDIDKRKEEGVCFSRNEDVSLGLRAILSSDNDSEAEMNRLLGICASPGEVTAKVKVVLSRADIGKVEPGDIMVAVGTDFDLLEIMNLSGGIITEEGGLLSHASVVSRELKKPCLIGVPRATQVLHDGDELKLDATGGKITILKRG